MYNPETIPTFKGIGFGHSELRDGVIIKLGDVCHGLKETNEPRVDEGFAGCKYRIGFSGTGAIRAANLKLTGKAFVNSLGSVWKRGELEIVGDCEPSTFHKVLIRFS